MRVDNHHAAHGGNRASEKAVPVSKVDDFTAAQEWLSQMRGWFLIVATLAACMTYRAGLLPPCGNPALHDNRHTAGDPVPDYRVVMQYRAFLCCNTMAFAMSMVAIILLLAERFYKSKVKVAALTLTTMSGLVNLLGAYIAGSMPTSICIIVFASVCVCVLIIYIMNAAGLFTAHRE